MNLSKVIICDTPSSSSDSNDLLIIRALTHSLPLPLPLQLALLNALPVGSMPPTSTELAMPIPLSTVSFTTPPNLSIAAILALGSIVLGRTMLLLWSRLAGGTFDATLVELFAKDGRLGKQLTKLSEQPYVVDVKDLEVEAAMEKLASASASVSPINKASTTPESAKIEKPVPVIPPRPKAKPERTQIPADVYLTEDEIMSILYTSATFRESTSVLGYAPDPLLPPLIEVDEE